jgi:tRNA wybutosine-synthesizing protein 1
MSCSGEFSIEETPRLRYHVINGYRIRISSATREKLMDAKYGVSGHSTVELCHWTRSALTGGASCYKFKFYGAPVGGSHRCVELSPVGMICSNRCVYCWRPSESFDTIELTPEMVDDPEDVVNGILRERYRLLTGYFGHPRSSRDRVNEALMPTHWAISLSGEPTLYPKLPQLIKYIKSLPSTRSIFLVTNGQHPEMLQRLQDEDALPTQLYLSCNAPNRELYYKVNVPVMNRDDAWERWLRSLELLSRLNTRTVVRITLIGGWNNHESLIPEYAKLMRIGNPHFIEIKSYMHLGHSTYRLGRESMLRHEDVREWGMRMLDELSKLGSRFWLMDESVESRIVVLQNMDRYVDRYIG